jgi:hypothetical protein
MPKPPPSKPAIGFNIQITKVTDIGGGQETVTINTAAEPGASPEAIYGKIKTIRAALQKEIDFNRELEKRRQAQEDEVARAFMHQQGTRSPVDLPAMNGHDPEADDPPIQTA